MSGRHLGRHLLRVVKETAGTPGPDLCIPVGTPTRALLRPVATRKELVNAGDVRMLTEWRNRFARSFLTEFNATEQRTRSWLVETVGPSDRKILFMVDDLSECTYGHMGLAFIDWEKASGEVDAVVRGREAPSGLMKLALREMILYAHYKLLLSHVVVRVLSDNTAVDFYRRVGFIEEKRVPLRRVEEEGLIRWVEDGSLEAAERSIVHMSFPLKDDLPVG